MTTTTASPGSPNPPGSPASSRATPARRVENALATGIAKVTGSALGPYQTAVVRIGFALTWLGFLLREFPHRHQLYGPDSPWSWELAQRQTALHDPFTMLLWSRQDSWFEVVYALAVLSALGLLLGWRTRTMSVLFMLGVFSFMNRSVIVGDGGDNVVHLMAGYLVLTRCGQVWSLDARRRRRQESGAARPGPDLVGVWLWTVLGFFLLLFCALGRIEWFWTLGPVAHMPGWGFALCTIWLSQGAWWYVRERPAGEPRAVLDALANLVHNAGLLIIVVQVCFIYATAGWYKISGSRWQDGTAVYYPLKLDYFSPWPALGDVLAASGTMVMIVSYGTVMVQVAFPFTLFNRRLKNALLALMIVEHLSIAVLLGLPFFSLAMISADAVFLPTVFLVWAGARISALPRRLLRGRRAEAEPTEAPATAAGVIPAPRQGSPSAPVSAPVSASEPEPEPEPEDVRTS
ncbi:HTTM domain-containing protein [Streptomyces polyrhachis]|uniref:HTTM domain-containing protein n=1 Tax=Streptomyces polyrhachis TaxID=1282885 RepID=A0ABW2GCU5_9ACTN